MFWFSGFIELVGAIELEFLEELFMMRPELLGCVKLRLIVDITPFLLEVVDSIDDITPFLSIVCFENAEFAWKTSPIEI